MANPAYDQTLPIRQRVIALARQQVGCHYVWGGAGNTPDQNDGAFYRLNAVKMHFDDLGKGRPGMEPARQMPILYAAWCRVDGDKVCAGRSTQPDVMSLPDGTTLNASPMDPSRYKWPRPDGVINSATKTFGESCIGVRHFDCIGLVNWAVSQAAKPTHYGIPSIITNTTDVGFNDVQAGDIVTINQTHIGIASGTGTVIQAKGTKYGVVETQGYAGFTRCGRPPVSFWR